MTWVACLLRAFTRSFRSRTSPQIENFALRHQLAVYRRTGHRPRLRPSDRIFWARLSRSGNRGRPPVSPEVRDLIRKMSSTNPLWGSPRIVGELRMIGIDLPKSTVEKHMIRRR